ncbi:hypothetical protein AYO20_03353 [Fonsecaea nubica]|uniref:Hsp70-like protein n=1 Tax=Fonsecaea nubica TaxID=856822 RepID=A0A178D817_9EURO|nr:hypothetical protein AYO20_03353 [Fonsecaea nubica]OAL37504.1 hypothetical protein AYO20_03353 [Fonsecaea nubica]
MAPAYKPLGIRDRRGKVQAPTRTPTSKRKREDQARPKKKTAKTQRTPGDSDKPKKTEEFLSVGLDIGTTASAIAYAASIASPEEICVLDSYEGHVVVKVPTRMAYAAENDFRTDKWGFQVESGMQICNWPKLRLDENTNKEDFDDPLLQQAIGDGLMHIPDGKTASEVIEDFVSNLRKYWLQRLDNTILETAIKHARKRICVPVPTTWSPAAREATHQAAIKAGFGEGKRDEIIIIDESEAAALDVIKSLEKSSDADQLEEGVCVMVIDCGGGTIDSASYKITSSKPLQLEEACAGEGGAKIGGTSIDRALHALMQEHFGVAFSGLPISKVAATSHFMQDFETHKKKYDGQTENKDLWLRLNMRKLDDQDENIRNRYDFMDLAAKITSADLHHMFEPVIQKIFEIIRGQARRIAKARPATSLRIIAMCGGLSCNPHIFNQVNAFVGNLFEDGSVKVLAPRQPLTAVVRGAVLAAQGCSPIVSRRSREFIGTQIHRAWDEAKHRPEDRFECPERGLRAKNQMEWIVKKGQKLKPDMKARVRCYYVLENARAEVKGPVIDQVLYRCAEDIAPSRVDDPVEEIGVIRVDITNIARRKRAEARTGLKTYPGYIAIDVDIELTMSSSKGVLEAVAKIGRTKVGTTTITYTPAPAWEHGLIRKDEDK